MTDERPKKSSFFRRDDAGNNDSNRSSDASGFEKRNDSQPGKRPRLERNDNESPRSFNNDRPPFGGDRNNSSTDQRRSSSNDRKPYGSDRKPFSGDRERKPYDPDRKPYGGDRGNSYGGERRSFNSDRKPYDPDRKPFGGGRERKPYDPDRKPYGGDRGNSYGGERRSFNSDRKPYDPDRKPFSGDRERKPYDPDRKPFGGDRERKPFDPDRKPYDPDRKPYGDRTPFSGSKPYGERKFSDNRTKRSDRNAKTAKVVEQLRLDPNVPVRLNRFIAMSGVCSRREADELILAGEVTVNGVVADQLGTKVMLSDEVRLNGKILKGERKVYIIMNKPKGYITTTDDPHADHTVMDLLKDQVKERVYPIGRLDKNTTGVLLLTNDGELAQELTHPSFEKRKIYHVFLDKPVSEEDLAKLTAGITLEDGEIHADEVSYVDDRKNEVGVEIHSGRNHIVRRMFQHIGYEVEKLDRVFFAGFTKMGLRRGFWRYLTPREVTILKSGSYQ